jgi:cysteine-rich repeat protein
MDEITGHFFIDPDDFDSSISLKSLSANLPTCVYDGYIGHENYDCSYSPGCTTSDDLGSLACRSCSANLNQDTSLFFAIDDDTSVCSTTHCDTNFYTSNDLTCYNCHTSCTTCTGSTNADCDACATGFVDDSGECVCDYATKSTGKSMLNGACEFVCGNGYMTTNADDGDANDEACDDGNFDNYDGCTMACAVEDGYSCTQDANKLSTCCIADFLVTDFAWEDTNYAYFEIMFAKDFVLPSGTTDPAEGTALCAVLMDSASLTLLGTATCTLSGTNVLVVTPGNDNTILSGGSDLNSFTMGWDLTEFQETLWNLVDIPVSCPSVDIGLDSTDTPSVGTTYNPSIVSINGAGVIGSTTIG